jgi:hypothetical protein
VPFLAVFVVALSRTAIGSFFPSIDEALSHNSAFNVVWVLLWFLAIIGFLLGFTIRGLKCPACNQHFHSRRNGRFFMHNEFCRACMNCGLPLRPGSQRAP